jgi:hypothetical protein
MIVGEGDLKEQIENISRQKGFIDNVKLAGFRDDIPNVMRTIE